MEYLPEDDDCWPETISELQLFLQSLLSTLEFAHSRNVIMGDLHPENVYLFLWGNGKDI